LLPISERLSLSNFPDYIDRERANFVSKVKLRASHNNRIILSRADPVHECFYDLFNQNFRSLRSRDGAVILYSNIAMGGVSRRSKVHPDFECIVHVRGSDVPYIPAPFLNRFEKYRVDIHCIRRQYMKGLPNAERILASVEEKVLSFVQNCSLRLGKPWIVGFTEEQTIPSLLIDFVPDKTWVDFCNMADTVNVVGYKRIKHLVTWITGGRIVVDESDCLRVYNEMKNMDLFDTEEGSAEMKEEGDSPLLLFRIDHERDVPREPSHSIERVIIGIISREVVIRLLPLATPEAVCELR
jgi:hypothetical protein